MFKTPVRSRVINNLVSLDKFLDTKLPPKVLDKNLIIGTWNIREFSKNRLEESYKYIAEVISRFDIIAIQELKTSFEPLSNIKEYLGEHWSFLVSHPCTSHKGNSERMAFVYDTRRVKFSGISSFVSHYGSRGEISLDQFSRSPYMAGFSVGDFKFFLCNVHFYYDSGRPNSKFRRSEIQRLLERFDKKKVREKYGYTDNFIILGDFNIPSVSSSSYTEMLSHDYESFDSFTRPSQTSPRIYDQIIYRTNSNYFKNTKHGKLKLFDSIFKDCDDEHYKEHYRKTRMNYSQWRTFQLSDHDPLWLQLEVSTNQNRWAKSFYTDKYKTQPSVYDNNSILPQVTVPPIQSTSSSIIKKMQRLEVESSLQQREFSRDNPLLFSKPSSSMDLSSEDDFLERKTRRKSKNKKRKRNPRR